MQEKCCYEIISAEGALHSHKPGGQTPYLLFGSDFRAAGRTIELEFATRTVMNYDAVILSCLSGGRGLYLTAQKVQLNSEQSEISMQFKENEHSPSGTTPIARSCRPLRMCLMEQARHIRAVLQVRRVCPIRQNMNSPGGICLLRMSVAIWTFMRSSGISALPISICCRERWKVPTSTTGSQVFLFVHSRAWISWLRYRWTACSPYQSPVSMAALN